MVESGDRFWFSLGFDFSDSVYGSVVLFCVLISVALFIIIRFLCLFLSQ